MRGVTVRSRHRGDAIRMVSHRDPDILRAGHVFACAVDEVAKSSGLRCGTTMDLSHQAASCAAMDCGYVGTASL